MPNSNSKNEYGFSMSGETWKNEINKLMQSLSVVVNNTPGNIGGGGVPLQPLAPEFGSNITSAVNCDIPDIMMFPNPLEGEDLFFNKNVSVQIFSSLGNLLARFEDKKSINFSNFKPGIYLLRISDGDYHATRKLVKIK